MAVFHVKIETMPLKFKFLKSDQIIWLEYKKEKHLQFHGLAIRFLYSSI